MSSEQLCQILGALLSEDNSTRNQAEAAFSSWKKTDADGLLRLLLRVLREVHEDHVRQQAAVVIRNVLRDFIFHRPDSVWPHISAECKQLIKSQLLNVLETEGQKAVRRSICDTVADLAGELIGEWPELTVRLMQLVGNNQKPSSQAAGLKILAELVPQLSSLLRANPMGFAHLVASCAKSGDAEVRYECLAFVTSLIMTENRSIWKHLQVITPDMITGLKVLLDQRLDDAAV